MCQTLNKISGTLGWKRIAAKERLHFKGGLKLKGFLEQLKIGYYDSLFRQNWILSANEQLVRYSAWFHSLNSYLISNEIRI